MQDFFHQQYQKQTHAIFQYHMVIFFRMVHILYSLYSIILYHANALCLSLSLSLSIHIYIYRIWIINEHMFNHLYIYIFIYISFSCKSMISCCHEIHVFRVSAWRFAMAFCMGNNWDHWGTSRIHRWLLTGSKAGMYIYTYKSCEIQQKTRRPYFCIGSNPIFVLRPNLFPLQQCYTWTGDVRGKAAHPNGCIVIPPLGRPLGTRKMSFGMAVSWWTKG